MKPAKRVLRRITPSDGIAYEDFVASLSAQTKRQRMLGAGVNLNPQLLARALASVPGESAVWGIFDDEVLLAVGRYAPEIDQARTAEFAVTVADSQHGQGLGTSLLKTLKLLAAQDGYRRLSGLAFADNDAMLGLARSQGFETKADPKDAGLALMQCSLGPTIKLFSFEPAPSELPV
jgi:GNAT superfamily N-acetyltransferase